MSKFYKMVIATLMLIAITGTTALAAFNSGKLSYVTPYDLRPANEKKFIIVNDIKNLTWYRFNGEIVSAVTSGVTSGVTSVVVSDVTSPAGTSRVASAVTSPVTSAVTSAVAPVNAPDVNIKGLSKLTEETLKKISQKEYQENFKMYEEQAKKDFMENPKMFMLSNKEKFQITELYEKENPKEFYFIINKSFAKLPLSIQKKISAEWEIKMSK